MDGPFHQLLNCEKMSLSSNCISVITNLSGFKRLKLLSLGRNCIKTLHGIESAGDTLESLWISYNSIDRLKPIRSLQKLKVYINSVTLLRMLVTGCSTVKPWYSGLWYKEFPCYRGQDSIFQLQWNLDIVDSSDSGKLSSTHFEYEKWGLYI